MLDQCTRARFVRTQNCISIENPFFQQSGDPHLSRLPKQMQRTKVPGTIDLEGPWKPGENRDRSGIRCQARELVLKTFPLLHLLGQL